MHPPRIHAYALGRAWKMKAISRQPLLHLRPDIKYVQYRLSPTLRRRWQSGAILPWGSAAIPLSCHHPAAGSPEIDSDKSNSAFHARFSRNSMI